MTKKPYNDTQRREIFHFLFLEELLRISDPKLYILKGGVNLRFFFKSPRYSEDMDLDVLSGSMTTLKKNGYKILNSAPLKRSLLTYGIADLQLNDPAKAKHTETTQRFRLRLITEAGDSLPTKVEFSRRNEEDLVGEIERLDPDIAKPYQRLAFRCQHYSGSAAVVQKIRALAGRDVTQARDVFDLGILQAGGHVDRRFIKQKMSKDKLEKAKANLLSIEYEQFKGQVLEFLNQDVRSSYEGKNSWEDLKRTVLEEILND